MSVLRLRNNFYIYTKDPVLHGRVMYSKGIISIMYNAATEYRNILL